MNLLSEILNTAHETEATVTVPLAPVQTVNGERPVCEPHVITIARHFKNESTHPVEVPDMPGCDKKALQALKKRCPKIKPPRLEFSPAIWLAVRPQTVTRQMVAESYV